MKNSANILFIPGLGLVFGAGAGLLMALLCHFPVAAGLVWGGAAGLLAGLVIRNLHRAEHREKDSGEA